MIVEKNLILLLSAQVFLKNLRQVKKTQIAACDIKISEPFYSVPNLTDPVLPYLITENLCVCEICFKGLSRNENFFCKFKHFYQYFLCMH
jgi:hypothetical protein